jgi:hypothetical protein
MLRVLAQPAAMARSPLLVDAMNAAEAITGWLFLLKIPSPTVILSCRSPENLP